MVGITNGWPSLTKPTWQISASSRIASIVSRSYAPRSGCRRTHVLTLGDATVAIVRTGLLDEPALEVGSEARQRERDDEEHDHHRAEDLDAVALEEPDRLRRLQALHLLLRGGEELGRPERVGERAVLDDVHDQAHERRDEPAERLRQDHEAMTADPAEAESRGGLVLLTRDGLNGAARRLG